MVILVVEVDCAGRVLMVDVEEELEEVETLEVTEETVERSTRICQLGLKDVAMVKLTLFRQHLEVHIGEHRVEIGIVEMSPIV